MASSQLRFWEVGNKKPHRVLGSAVFFGNRYSYADRGCEINAICYSGVMNLIILALTCLSLSCSVLEVQLSASLSAWASKKSESL